MDVRADDLKINLLNSSLQPLGENKPVPPQVEGAINPNEVTDRARQQFCEQFNITPEQLENLLIQYPDLFSKSPENVQDIINQQVGSETLSGECQNGQETEIEVLNNGDKPNLQFNHRAFAALSTEDKFVTYATELVKNKFLYGEGSKHSVEEWNNLSEQAKQQLINIEIANLKHGDLDTAKTDEELVDIYLNAKMVTLQTANMLEKSFDSFNRLDADKVEEHVHSYLFGLDDENKTELQIQKQKNDYEFSQILINACREKGLTDYEHLWNGQATYNLEPTEIKRMLSDLKTTRIQLINDTLQKKINDGIATEEEQKQYRYTSELIKAEQEARNENVNKGVFDAFKNDPEYSQGWNGCIDIADRTYLVLDYLNGKFANYTNNDDKAELLDGMVNDLILSGETELAKQVKFASMHKADSPLQVALGSHKGTRADAVMTALSADAFGENKEALSALEETQRSFAVENAEFSNQLAYMTMEHANNKQNDHLSALYADKERWGEPVQQKAVDLAFDCDDAKSQYTRLMNVNEKSSTKVKINAGTRIYEAHNENQAPLGLRFMETKEVANAMNEAGTLTKCCTEAQQPLFAGLKNRFECDDYTKEEAVNQLNILSDQIQYCDKDNQLAMHENIMTSKYSEVQEHAAGNIKNYDPSVQLDAMSSVYKSGNQKAIETAVANISEFKSPDVQQIAIKQAIMELAGSQDTDFSAKFANGTLTNKEIAQLSLAERREYYVSLFEKASPAEKIKYLKELPAGRSKQTAYNIIGTYYKNLFIQMVQDDVQIAEAMFNMGLKPELHSVIENCIVSKADTDPSFKFLRDRLKLSADEEYPQTAKTLTFTSIPNGLGERFDSDKFALFKKDRYGNLLG